jgi:hypothetical protein
VRVDLLAIAAPNVERRLKPMPPSPALVRQIRRSSLDNRVHAAAWEPPGEQALDIGLHYAVAHYLSAVALARKRNSDCELQWLLGEFFAFATPAQFYVMKSRAVFTDPPEGTHQRLPGFVTAS